MVRKYFLWQEHLNFLVLIGALSMAFSCNSRIEVDLKDKDSDLGIKSITLLNPFIKNITYNSFQVEMRFSNDNNLNASATLYFCNHTSSPSCDPLAGSFKSMTLVSNTFSTSLSSLPNFKEDQYLIQIVITDPDGVINNPSKSLVSLLRAPPRAIYRSVGPSSTTALDTNATGTLSVSGSLATFSAPVSDNIGVGDIIVYNSNGNFAVISERIDAQNFSVYLADGRTIPTATTSDNTWQVFRAYTSLANAENGDENTGIPAITELSGGRDFDSWSGGRDLVANHEQWNIALYADADDSGGTQVNGWTTSNDNFLKIYTPTAISEVGNSQRHNGTFASGYVFKNILRIMDTNVVIDGISLDRTSGTYLDGALSTSGLDNDDGFIKLRNSLIRTFFVDGNENAVDFRGSGLINTKFYAYNNIVIGSEANGLFVAAGTNDVFIYNNTIHAKGGFRTLTRSSGNAYFKNNIAISTGGAIGIRDDGGSGAVMSSLNNISNAGISSQFDHVSNKENQEIAFNSLEAYDLRLAGNSYAAIGTGLDLSNDSNLAFSDDILGNTRTRWDVGASTAPTAIFRSIGSGNTLSLKGASDREISIAVNSDGHTQMTLAGGTTDLPLNVGVGDAIQYDEDDTGGVDNIAFISERIDQNNFIVKAADGSNAIITSANSTNWDIFRAYTGLNNVNTVTENTGIDVSLADFDSTSRLDLVSNNSQLYLPLYADAAEGNWRIDNFSSEDNNYLKVYAPSLASEVSLTQRHSGFWDNTKSRIEVSDYFGAIYIPSGTCMNCLSIRMDGLQVNNTNTGAGPGYGVYFNSRSSEDIFYFTNNIIKKTVEQKGVGIRIRSGNGASYIINNIIYGFDIGISHYFQSGNGSSTFIYNNTIDDSLLEGLVLGGFGSNDTAYIKNNIFKDAINEDYKIQSGIENLSTDTNITYDATSPDGASFQNQTVGFVDSLNEEYNLLMSDTSARGRATDLTFDSIFSFDYDIKGTTRSTWDIGAHAY